jgi:hypothetical protein
VYPIEVQQFNLARKISGTSYTQPVIGFLCTGDAAIHNPPDESLMWMSLDLFSKYHALHLKANPPPPPPPPPEGGSLTVAGVDDDEDDGDDDDDDDEGGVGPSKVKDCFGSPVILSTKVVEKKLKRGKVKTKTLKQHQYECLDNFSEGDTPCGKQKRVQWGTSTGALSDHVQKRHPLHWKAMITRGDIKGPSKLVVVDGEVVMRLSFEESFGGHVAFVIMCYLDAVPFYRSRTKGMRQFCAELKSGYFPPHRETAIRILEVIDELMREEMALILKAHIKVFRLFLK